jgi:hypothetical protein
MVYLEKLVYSGSGIKSLAWSTISTHFWKYLESKSNRHKRGGEVAHHHGPGDPCRKKAMNYGWTHHEATWTSAALGPSSLCAWRYNIMKSYRPKKERAKDQSLLQSQLSMTHFPLLLFFMTLATIYLICECTWIGMAWRGDAMRHGSILITRMEYCKMAHSGVSVYACLLWK